MPTIKICKKPKCKVILKNNKWHYCSPKCKEERYYKSDHMKRCELLAARKTFFLSTADRVRRGELTVEKALVILNKSMV